jgi:hypothetical protein
MFARDEFSSPAPARLDDITARPLPWVHAARRAPYFTTDDGEPWTPVGHNDAIAWPPLMWPLDRTDDPDAYFLAVFGSGDRHQAALWVVRREPLARDGTLCRIEAADRVTLQIPGLLAGASRITTFNTEAGIVEARFEAATAEGPLRFEVPVLRDLALAIRPAAKADGSQRVNS